MYPCQPELNYCNVYEQEPSIVRQNSIQMSPHTLHTPPQMSPIPCMSMSAKPLNAASLPVPSPMSFNGYHSQLETPLMNSPHLDSWTVSQQTVVPSLRLNDDKVYSCNFVGQLQGSYVIETPAGFDQVNVIIPDVFENEDQFAIVRRVCSDGEALPDQFIQQEAKEFRLCSVDGNVLAVLRKGSNMKHKVTWQNYCSGSQIVWKRKGEVTFNLVHVDSLAASSRNSISSIDTSSTVFGSCFDSSLVGLNGLPMRISPELRAMPEDRPYLMNSPSCLNYSPNESFQNKQSVGTSTNESDEQELVMFELIKAQCLRNTSLLKKMVNWAMKNNPDRDASHDKVSSMTAGRLYITAHAAGLDQGAEIEESFQESLDDIKGAYTKVQEGFFEQPKPQVNEPGVQHRLFKSRQGYWRIEANDVESEKWQICAQELPYGLWQDMKNKEKLMRVQLIPMRKILQKMREGFMPCNEEVEKNIEFLFTSCNQKKLNRKLKGRNLKHSISNLTMKLEKQYSLSFALQVATTADCIARELQVLS